MGNEMKKRDYMIKNRGELSVKRDITADKQLLLGIDDHDEIFFCIRENGAIVAGPHYPSSFAYEGYQRIADQPFTPECAVI